MIKTLGMSKEKLLALDPRDVDRQLYPEEIVYMAKVLDAFWQYDYDAAKKGQVGMHAVLKSGLHSDGFFVSKILLESVNIRQIIAMQMVLRLCMLGIPKPMLVAGVPDGATKLGEEVARIMKVPVLEMKKVDEKIVLVGSINIMTRTLLVEDFCTRGTGFKEAVLDIMSKHPYANLLPVDLCILNRGGLKEIVVDKVGSFKVAAAVEHRINDWEPPCPLCKAGSIPIKPKATEENWRLINVSQR